MRPTKLRIPSGQSHRFYCLVKSPAPFDLHWYKNNKSFTGAHDRAFADHVCPPMSTSLCLACQSCAHCPCPLKVRFGEDKVGPFLYIENLVVSDSGNYKCVASNGDASSSYTYKLDVMGKAVFDKARL